MLRQTDMAKKGLHAVGFSLNQMRRSWGLGRISAWLRMLYGFFVIGWYEASNSQLF